MNELQIATKSHVIFYGAIVKTIMELDQTPPNERTAMWFLVQFEKNVEAEIGSSLTDIDPSIAYIVKTIVRADYKNMEFLIQAIDDQRENLLSQNEP